MATARVDHIAAYHSYGIRPALAEARLISEKHACDASYVTNLSEELRTIETMIVTMEQDLQLASVSEPAKPAKRNYPCHSEVGPGADWIRAKSGELDFATSRNWRVAIRPKMHRLAFG